MTTRDRPPFWSRLTVRGWVVLVLGLMIAWVIVASIVGARSLGRTAEVSNYLQEVIQPAEIEAQRLQGALLNQETGARGYIIAADPSLLEPYEAGREEETRASDALRSLIAKQEAVPGVREQLLADLEAIDDAADEWRRVYTLPLVNAVVPGEPRPVDVAVVEAGGSAFDRLRELFEIQRVDLAEARDDAVAALDDARVTRDRLFVTMIAVFLLSGMCVAFLVHLLIVRPLSRLGEETRKVARGNFDQRISVDGPSDIRALAIDVDGMRAHLAHELEVSKEHHDQVQAQAVELRRSNAELEQFAYVASHDLQEPLRKVASFCQLLEKRYGDKLDERGQQYIDFAVDGAKRMQVLINDLLTFSRVGRVGDTHVSVELGRSLDSALANLSESIDESGARIERPESLPRITGDPTLMTMLWQNLVGNAIKFRKPNQAPVVRIECSQTGEGDDATWNMSVSDNGIGIADEFAEKVFVIFQRLHGRDAYGGTGIGLALCRKIVEYHGGEIWIDRAYTDGCRFCFTIPVLREAESETDEVPEGAPA
ncbi:ATP-binding protein [Rhodococcus sp. SMB37]|uniref:sensor histidine kinase n=1 Tax=Rhodococcus sp. SMB37 TaxID=2512213 RepID=UPI0006D06D8B|nr:ATP-binding protein [Rhodococcus sp. SMB37]